MSRATIFDIERNSFSDGPGIRTTVFFKGCNLRCAWCHNPESQSPTRQMLFYENKCVGCGKCKEKCPQNLKSCSLCGRCALFCPRDAREICGEEYTSEEVLSEILKDKDYYETSGGGVTFSGGECMLQIDFLAEILRSCKENGIHTAVDTAGNVPYGYFERIMPHTDIFLYDVKTLNCEKHRVFTGVGNELILSNLKKLLLAGKRVWVRIPVVTGFNATEDDIRSIRRFLTSCGVPEKIELLPYHALGEHKYAALGRNAQSFSVPTAELMERLHSCIRE